MKKKSYNNTGFPLVKFLSLSHSLYLIYSQIFSLSSYTPENYRVTVSRLVDEDSSKYDVTTVVKWFTIVSDTFINNPLPCGIPEKEIGVLDFKGFSWWHLMKIAGNLSTVRALLRYVQVVIFLDFLARNYPKLFKFKKKLN